MPLTLLFPDTLLADPAPLRHASVLAGQQLLRRAHCMSQLDDDAALPLETPYEQWLRRELKLPSNVSLEAGSAFVDGLGVSHWRLTPAHLHLGADHIVLTDPTQLPLDQASALELVDAIAATLTAAGMTVTLANPHRWYLSAPADFDLSAHSWRVASGRSIDGFQPTGPSARRWRQVLTEIQMVWHQHPLNEQRAQLGLPVVNSIWLDGRCAPAQRFDYDVCCTDLLGLSGIARNAQATTHRSLRIAPIAALNDLLRADPLQADSRRLLVVFDPCPMIKHSGATDDPATSSDRDDAAFTERLATHWQHLVETFSSHGVLPVLADLARASRREPLRIVLTGDRRIVELRLGPWDLLALSRQLRLLPLFETGERALLRRA